MLRSNSTRNILMTQKRENLQTNLFLRELNTRTESQMRHTRMISSLHLIITPIISLLGEIIYSKTKLVLTIVESNKIIMASFRFNEADTEI